MCAASSLIPPADWLHCCPAIILSSFHLVVYLPARGKKSVCIHPSYLAIFTRYNKLFPPIKNPFIPKFPLCCTPAPKSLYLIRNLILRSQGSSRRHTFPPFFIGLLLFTAGGGGEKGGLRCRGIFVCYKSLTPCRPFVTRFQGSWRFVAIIGLLEVSFLGDFSPEFRVSECSDTQKVVNVYITWSLVSRIKYKFLYGFSLKNSMIFIRGRKGTTKQRGRSRTNFFYTALRGLCDFQKFQFFKVYIKMSNYLGIFARTWRKYSNCLPRYD